jgi:small subunit ribosomal protein S8
MITDPIANYLTRLRNAIGAGHRVVEMPSSRMTEDITKILLDQGYVANYKVEVEGVKKTLKIALKYDPVTKLPVIKKLRRVSKPGLRQYTGVDTIPRVLNGLGIAIVSTSKGVMTGKQAKQENVGGEVLCYIY